MVRNPFHRLNAPTGAWCSLTARANRASARAQVSQCTYRCVVLPDETEVLETILHGFVSQCTYRCVVLPDCTLQLLIMAAFVSMHLQVRGAP